MLVGDDINPNFSEVYENIATQPLSIKTTPRQQPGGGRKKFRTTLAHGPAGQVRTHKKLLSGNFQ